MTIEDTDHSALRKEVELLRRQLDEARSREAERRNTASALEENERFLNNVFEGIRDGISILDGELTVLRVNSWMEEMYAAQMPLVGRKCYEVYHSADAVCPWCPSVKALRTGEPTTALVPYQNPGSEPGWLELSAYPLRDDEGAITGVIEHVKDVTERKQVADEARSLRRQLERRVARRTAELSNLNRELEAFAYSISHDLRAPLRAINGFSQLLLEDYLEVLDEVGQGYLHRIRAGTERMGRLIDHILQLSRIARQPIRRESCDLSAMAREVAAELATAEPRRSCELRVDEELVEDTDPLLARVVLENLLGNAWKFTRGSDPARIHFGLRRADGGQREYFVRDNGVGFDTDHADAIFGIFRRLHSGREFEGDGVGLASVHRIILRLGGVIHAEGEPGRGATFRFTLGPSVADAHDGAAD